MTWQGVEIGIMGGGHRITQVCCCYWTGRKTKNGQASALEGPGVFFFVVGSVAAWITGMSRFFWHRLWPLLMS